MRKALLLTAEHSSDDQAGEMLLFFLYSTFQ
jgi:hypothetical protein